MAVTVEPPASRPPRQFRPQKSWPPARRKSESLGIEAATPTTTSPKPGFRLSESSKLLLISANEIGRRAPQHKAVIDAAKQVGVPLIAYTSILKADTSPLALAEEHKETEAYLRASGIPAVILRNGWYTENHTAGLSAALAHGSIFGQRRGGKDVVRRPRRLRGRRRGGPDKRKPGGPDLRTRG